MAVDPNVDPFASIGGGVRTAGGGWIPKGMTPPPSGAPAGGAPSGGLYDPNQTQGGQATAASTYSTTPEGTPSANTTNAGGQDVYRNALISQMSQDPSKVSVEDPAIKAQLDPYTAQIERSRREEVRRGAEEAFGADQAYGAPEKLAAAERAGQQKGLVASDLVGRELMARRQQISDALRQFGSTLSDDQRRQLEKYQIDLDAQLRREGLSQTGSLGNRELDIRDKLGMGGLNIDMLRTLLQNKQFDTSTGIDVGYKNALLNNSALQSLF